MSEPKSIAEQLVLLAELSNVDSKVRQVNEKLETLPVAAKKGDEETVVLRKQLDDVAKKRAEIEKQKRTTEGEMVDERTKIKKWEARANDIRGEREQTALFSEVSTAKRVLSKLEDTQLENMEKAEELEKQEQALRVSHDKSAARAKEEWDKIAEEMAALRVEGEELKTAKLALLAKFPAPLVKRYETIAAKRQGQGVAVIVKDSCTACRRLIPAQLSLQVRRGLVLETCDGCARLLVHEDMTRAPTPAA